MFRVHAYQRSSDFILGIAVTTSWALKTTFQLLRFFIWQLVFGREDSGLTGDEVLQCNHICCIPSGKWEGSLSEFTLTVNDCVRANDFVITVVWQHILGDKSPAQRGEFFTEVSIRTSQISVMRLPWFSPDSLTVHLSMLKPFQNRPSTPQLTVGPSSHPQVSSQCSIGG